MMYTSSFRFNQIFTRIIYGTKKSKQQTTPRLFKNPKLTPDGILQKPQRSYDYNLPENLPNRHLYWHKTEQNRIYRKRYRQHKLYKLKIDPIHEDGKRTYNRDINLILSELTSLKIIKQSIGRTFENIYELISRFPESSLRTNVDGQFKEGEHADILKFALDELHNRHLASMSYRNFCVYCQLRYMSGNQPTESILIHFYRHVRQMRDMKSDKISLDRLSKLTRYVFSRKYSEECTDFFFKKERQFKIFGDTVVVHETFDEVTPQIYTKEYLQGLRDTYKKDEIEKMCRILRVLPGGDKLVRRIAENTG